MFPEFSAGTFLWQWFHSWAGLNAMTIALIVAALVVGLTRFTRISTLIKLLVTAGTVATLPLGLSKMGIEVPVYDPQLTAYLSFFGAVAVVGLGVPYLFSQILRSTSGKKSTYTGLTGQFDNPVATKMEASAKGEMGETMDFGGDAPNQNTLNFRSGPKAGDTINIGPKTMTVGRSPDNDIVIDDPTVSRQHARITFDGNQFYVEDLNSTSGTKINGKNVAKEAIMAGATMKMGNTEIGFNNNGVYQEKFPPQAVPASDNPGETRVIGKSAAGMTWLAGTAGAAAGQTCHLKEGNNTIGRDADNAVVLDDPYASRQHAVVRVEDGKAHLFDLGDRITADRISDFGYPEPYEPHPIPNDCQARKIAQVCAETNGRLLVTPLMHGYGPHDDFVRRFRVVAESPADGVWINRYGYLSDQKLDAVGQIWS